MIHDSFIIVAVDGGAASGKSSTSRLLSERFNFLFVSTGNHYRSVTWALLQAGLDKSTEKEVENHLAHLPLGIVVDGKEAKITLDSKTLGEEIRSEAVNDSVSHFAALPVVRNFLLEHQRSYQKLAQDLEFSGLIMEGRDIGSVIFPDAQFKFFMFADEAERARRRRLEGLVDSIKKRDQIDKGRKTAPFVCPEGATKIDTTHLNLREVVDKMASIIQSGKNA